MASPMSLTPMTRQSTDMMTALCSPIQSFRPASGFFAGGPSGAGGFWGLPGAPGGGSPQAASGLIPSIVAIHFGRCARSPSFGRPRNCLAATRSSSRPSTIFTQLTQVAGEPDELAPAGPETLSTIAPTAASPVSQPATNSGPLARARREVSISTTAMIGTGLSATPTASASDPPIACPTGPCLVVPRCEQRPDHEGVQRDQHDRPDRVIREVHEVS